MEGNQSGAQQELLVEGYDTEQVDMMAEQVILVDHSDRVLGDMSLPSSNHALCAGAGEIPYV